MDETTKKSQASHLGIASTSGSPFFNLFETFFPFLSILCLWIVNHVSWQKAINTHIYLVYLILLDILF